MELFRTLGLRRNSRYNSTNSPRRRVHLESLERRDLLAADGLVISEIQFDPTFGHPEEDEYFEVRGMPGATIPTGTYFVVVEGGSEESQNPGTINSMFDLGGLTLGSNGYLAVMQGGSSFSVNPAATTIQGSAGFAGLPGDRFSDNGLLSNRFEFIFDSNTFMLIQTGQTPAPDLDVDQNDDGQVDAGFGWTVLDSVSVLGTHVGGSPTDIAYGDIVFRAGGNLAPAPGKTIVDLAEVTYVARMSSSGSEASDWMAGETREFTEDQFDFELFARAGNEPYRQFVGRSLDHVGGANFFASVSGTLFHDENGNGSRDAGELGFSGGQVYLDHNADGIQNSFETVAEPDTYLENDVLTHAFPGVTLTTADDNNDILSFDIVAEDVAEASTGSLAFSQGTRRLMMDFTNPVESISIDFSAGFSSRRGILEAYDRDGNLLDAYLTQVLTEAAETMTASSVAADIAFAVAYADDAISPFGTLDNLRFTQPDTIATTYADGDFEFGYVVPRPGSLLDVRPLTDPHEVVTTPANGKHSIQVPFAVDFTGLEMGVESRQPFDLIGRTNTGAWWEALSDGGSFTNEFQTNWSTLVTWEDVLEGRFRGNRSEIVGRNGRQLWVSENNGSTVIPRLWGNLPYSDGWVDVMVGDLNGDQRSDWVGRHNGEWWVGQSTENDNFAFQQWSTWSNGVTWEDVLLGDFNGDGRDDIAGRANGDWWIAVSTGTSPDFTFHNQYWGNWSNQVQWEDVMVGDFNGDGYDDIAGRANGSWWVSRSNGSAFVTEYWGKWSNTIAWTDVMSADFNGDGKDDIAGRANGTWWVSQAVDNFFATSLWATWSNSVEWIDVVAADFNGDGRDDIAGRANGDWWVAVSNGQQFATQLWARWSTAVQWLDVQVGQFGDGGIASGSSVVDLVGGLPGDVNRNGKVGFEDFLILSGNYGDEVDPGFGGDVDGDGTVGFSDFLLVSANFGSPS